MIKNILTLLICIFILTGCSKVEIMQCDVPYYYLKDNPVDDYFENEYVIYNDSVSAINDFAESDKINTGENVML